MDEAADFAVSAVIPPALRKVEGSERSLPAVAQMGPHKSTASRAWGIGGSTPWWPSAMGDNFVSIVILSERSESKDLYLMQHARLPNESGSCVLASLPCSCPTMSDPPISAVILSVRSLPAVAGEPKDLYVPRAERLPTEVAHRGGGGSHGSAERTATG